MLESFPKSDHRIWEIDVLRALAVLGMIVFHWFYLLDYYQIQSIDLFNGGWEIFGDAIRYTFFAVVGAGLVLSYQSNRLKELSFWAFGIKKIKQGLTLLLLGGVITIFTLMVVPDQVIRFGVLSFIGAGMILLWPLVARWYLLLAFTLLVISIEFLFSEIWSHESLIGYILGFYPRYWPSLDYFPLIPWLASISAGALVASLIFKSGQRCYPWFNQPLIMQPLVWVGQKALIIYLMHIPVSAGLILFLGLKS
jgi:uncharacterized membrane protein